MDPVYCDRIRELMDRAQAWCLDIEELYNKAEVHSINTSNSQVTVFEFLESEKLVYLGWGNSVKRLTDCIINIYLMKLNLIL